MTGERWQGPKEGVPSKVSTKVGRAAMCRDRPTGEMPGRLRKSASPRKIGPSIVDNAVATQQPFGISPIVPPSPIKAVRAHASVAERPVTSIYSTATAYSLMRKAWNSHWPTWPGTWQRNYHGNRSVMTTFLDAQHSPRYRSSNC